MKHLLALVVCLLPAVAYSAAPTTEAGAKKANEMGYPYVIPLGALGSGGTSAVQGVVDGTNAKGVTATILGGSVSGYALMAGTASDITGAGKLATNSNTPTGRGNSQMVSVEATQVPISQGDVTGLSVAGNMTVTPFTEAMDGFAGNAMMVRMTKPIATTLTATVTGAAGAAVTLSLPAVAAKYHYIQDVHIKLFATAARSAGAAAIIVPTTNLGNSFYILDAGATPKGEFAGSLEDTGGSWQRSAATNTATTLVFPAVTDCIWYAMVQYVAAP